MGLKYWILMDEDGYRVSADEFDSCEGAAEAGREYLRNYGDITVVECLEVKKVKVFEEDL